MDRRIAAAVVLAATLALTAAAHAGMPIQLPALTRLASKLSGLKAEAKPNVKVVVTDGKTIEQHALRLLDRDYPRDQQNYDETLYRALGLLNENEALRPVIIARTKGVRGLYDPLTRTMWARRGPGLDKTLLLELVHYLQDRTFNLKRVASLRRGSRDAAAAAAAAFEGSATFFTEVLGRRMLASHTGRSRARLFLDLEGAFPFTTGLRFAASLQNLGGRPAIYSSLRTIPETTEQIFHLDAFLARERPLPLELPTSVGGFNLVRDDTFGELDVRALLAVYQVPRLDHTGDGWGAGLSALYRGAGGEAVAIRLDWDSELDARQWTEAAAGWVNEAFDADVPGLPPTVACASDACWSIARRGIALKRVGFQTTLVVAASTESAAALANGLLGL